LEIFEIDYLGLTQQAGFSALPIMVRFSNLF
jgi:hypothetical protein